MKALFWAILALLIAPVADACHPARAVQTRPMYVQVGDNTAVHIVAACGDGTVSVWHISWFEGSQPDLWGWAEIQNTASGLLRD